MRLTKEEFLVLRKIAKYLDGEISELPKSAPAWVKKLKRAGEQV